MSALAYLRRHWKIVLLFAAFTGIFALVFSLYDLPWRRWPTPPRSAWPWAR